jgi:hypothetical protein
LWQINLFKFLNILLEEGGESLGEKRDVWRVRWVGSVMVYGCIKVRVDIKK